MTAHDPQSCTRIPGGLRMTNHSEDFVMVEKSVVGGLTANVKRWRGRASAERLKRQRWRKRALAAEAEVERLRDALGVILAGLTDALGDPMGARPSQVATLYSVAGHAMRPIQSDRSGGEG